MPAVAAIPWLGTAIAGTAGATGAIVAGKMQSGAAKDAASLQTDAAKYGADKQDAAAQRAEQFARQQAENAWLNSQQTQRANYDQSKARLSTIASVGAQYGLPNISMPDYSPGIDPHFDTGQTPLGSTQTVPPAAGTIAGATPSAGGSPSAFLKGLLDSGMDPQAAAAKTNAQFNLQTGAQAEYYAPSEHTSGKAVIGLPDAYISQEPTGWAVTQRGGGTGTIAGAAKAAAPGMAAPVMAAPTVTTGIPTPYQPGTIASLARRY